MIVTTRAQRKALKAVFDRVPLFRDERSPDKIAHAHGWKFVNLNRHPEFPNLLPRYQWVHVNYPTSYGDSTEVVATFKYAERMTYRQFRKTATIISGRDPVLFVKWRDMILGIEPDGYTHS